MLLEEQHALNFESYARDALAAREMLARVVALGPIECREDAHERVELSSRVAIALAGLEDTRKKAVKPLNDQVKEINEMFAAVRVPGEEAVTAVKRMKSAWDDQERARERREREELERRQREAAEAERKAQEKLEAAKTEKARAKARAGIEAASAAQAAAAAEAPKPAATVLKGDSGGMSTRKVWTFEVVKPELVPAQYLVVDEAKIRAAVRSGAREIPGVSIFEDDQQVQRVRF
jgi:septal ring factor EnvC (AmiA/AmiB activator)